ncbi:hypothetical protein H8E52_01950 [bacterium]|nr:hypothetical protein [bacterium]
MPSRFKEADLSTVKKIKAADRKNLVQRSMVGKAGGGFDAWLGRLPKILAAEGLRDLVSALRSASEGTDPVVWLLGGHVVKTGVTPHLIRFMERGYATVFAMNGATAIHDVEMALYGATSEDVAENLKDGSFGMIAETADFFSAAMEEAEAGDLGLGESLGRKLAALDGADLSILAAAWRFERPATVHVSLGADILHQHPEIHTGKIGELSLRDFRILAACLGDLNENSVVVNLGSAVMGPEVFLKALTVARNLGHSASGFTACNLDMIQHYRPARNILHRPTAGGGKAIALTGHHEIMIPLLDALLD